MKALKNSHFYRLLQQKLSSGSRVGAPKKQTDRSRSKRHERKAKKQPHHTPSKSNHAVDVASGTMEGSLFNVGPSIFPKSPYRHWSQRKSLKI